MQNFLLIIEGTTPLLMHNARLSDPLDPISKQLKVLNSKRGKTEDDHEEIAHVEFMGGLYHNDIAGPYIPGINILASLRGGATLNKLGTRVDRGLFITTDENPLDYDGPSDPELLWKNGNFTNRASVGVGQSRVMRTRPMFREWKIEVEGTIDESQLDLDQLAQIADNAGNFKGLGDWRPETKGGRFGRFKAEIEAM